MEPMVRHVDLAYGAQIPSMVVIPFKGRRCATADGRDCSTTPMVGQVRYNDKQ